MQTDSLFEKNQLLLFQYQTIKDSKLKERFLIYNKRISSLNINIERCIHNKINIIKSDDESDDDPDNNLNECETIPSKSHKRKKTIKKGNQKSSIYLKNLNSQVFCKKSKIIAIDAIDLTKILVNHNVTQNIQGGFVIQNSEYINTNVVSIDFNSLFPSLILKYNLDSSMFAYWSQFLIYIPELDLYVSPFDKNYIRTVPIPIKYSNFLIYSVGYVIRSEICKSITSKYLITKMKERDKIKIEQSKLNSSIDRDYLNCKQLYLKLLMNTIYGNLNNIYCCGYLPELAALITMKGRNQLFSLSMFIKLYCITHKLTNNIFTVYGDTDSIFIKFLNINRIVNTEFLNYLRLEYRNNTDMQIFYQNWKSIDDQSTQDQYRKESISRWNIDSILDDDQRQDEWIGQVKKAVFTQQPWSSVYSLLKSEIRESDSELCIFITNDIINKFNLLPRNRISEAVHGHTDTSIQCTLTESILKNRMYPSNLVVSLKIEDHSSVFVLLKKKNYVFRVNKSICFKGKIFNNKNCRPVKEFILNFFKLLFRHKKSKSLSQSKLENIFKIYKSRKDEMFQIKEKFRSLNGISSKHRQLRFVASRKFIQTDLVYSYYKMFFEEPLFGKKLDYNKKNHCLFLENRCESTLLLVDLKNLILDGHVYIKPIESTQLEVDKEIILRKACINLLETLNNLLKKKQDVYLNFADIFTKVWREMFISRLKLKSNSKLKEYSNDAFLSIQNKRLKFNFKPPCLI